MALLVLERQAKPRFVAGDVPQGPIRLGGLEIVTEADEEPHRRGGRPGEFPDEGALADSRFSPNEDHFAASVGKVGDQTGQEVEFLLPFEQHNEKLLGSVVAAVL